MWQSRVHKARDFESSRSILNKSQLKSISSKNHKKDIKTNAKLFIKMSYTKYSPLNYGQNQDKDRIHKYSKKILHLALMTPIYLTRWLMIIVMPIMSILRMLLLVIFSVGFVMIRGGRKTRRDKMGPGNRKWDHTF